MNNKLILISLLLFFAIGVKGQEITQDSLTIDEKTTLLPEVVVSGHPTKKQSSFTFNKTELQLAGVKDSDMSFKPGGFLKRLFSFYSRKNERRAVSKRMSVSFVSMITIYLLKRKQKGVLGTPKIVLLFNS